MALSGSDLTITAVAAGESTISVTATDPGGLSATGSVMLTVSDPPPVTLPPSTMEVGDFVVIDLAEGERLTSSAQRIVSVEPGVDGDETKWTVRAEAKGTATIRHIGADGEVTGFVEVEVPNQAPMRTDTDNPRTSLYYILTPITSGADQHLSMTDFILEPFFTDPDGDELKYTFSSQSDEVLFVKAKNTAAGKCCTVIVDVLSETHESASIVVHATDGEEPATGTVEFQVGIDDDEVQSRTYKTDQQTDGDLATIVRVELRKHVDHTLEFVEVTFNGVLIDGFKFAKDFDDKLVNDGQFGKETDGTNTRALPVSSTRRQPSCLRFLMRTPLPTPMGVDTSRLGHDLATLSNWEPSIRTRRPNDTNPSLPFSVTGTGRAVVTINYHVWDTDLDGDGNADGDSTATPPVPAGTMDPGWRTASETVNIEISKVPEYASATKEYP